MSRRLYFNKMAANWDQLYCTPELTAFLENFVSMFSLKPKQRILDVGTGTGVLIPFLNKMVGPEGSITAIDYAENMIHICRSKYCNIKNVTIQLQNVEELDIPAESFDAITCFGLFPHLENKPKALNKMYLVLKAGGKLIIGHALSSSEIKDCHNNASSAMYHDFLPERSEMKKLLEIAGFVDIDIKDEPGFYLCLSNKPNE